ncbi:MAG: B12-binding domain-containing protein [Nitrososphaerales archaeon]|tara:strand:- start:636 stop:1493 length:858 start_codon:yes stop_codon:yes gene_type:complete
MVYIRNKQVKGISYSYLVRSVWDKDKKASKQETIKYLGRTEKITLVDIPKDYVDDKNILKFFAKESNGSRKNYNEYVTKVRKDLFKKLAGPGPINLAKVYDEYKDDFTILEFYDKIIKHILYDVGDLWRRDELMIGTEHVVSNRLLGIISELNKNQTRKKKRSKLLICNPSGERHNIVCNMLESILTDRGYNVYNISPSTPSKDVIKYVTNINPDMVMVSITLPANLQSGINLVKNISKDYNKPIVVGGQAITESSSKKFIPAIVMPNENTLVENLKEIRTLVPT